MGRNKIHVEMANQGLRSHSTATCRDNPAVVKQTAALAQPMSFDSCAGTWRRRVPASKGGDGEEEDTGVAGDAHVNDENDSNRVVSDSAGSEGCERDELNAVLPSVDFGRRCQQHV